MNKKHIHNLLIALFFANTALVLTRFFITDTRVYLFMIWNLFLAYIPLGIAYNVNVRGRFTKIEAISCGMIWLLFLPNSSYIITDFLHLGENKAMSAWFDIMILFTGSFCGLMMGIVSIIWMLEYANHFLSERIKNSLIIVVCFLSGFGVYVGRYLRWNSWDIFHRPIAIWQECMVRIIHPSEHLRTWGITILFGFFHLFLVVFFKKWQGVSTNQSIR